MAEDAGKPKYQFVDIDAKGGDAVTTAFANQVAYCTNADAPITARVVASVARLLSSGQSGEFLDRIRQWEGAPLADALPLRVAGGIHSLWLSRAEPALGALYRGELADDAGLIGAAIERHEAVLLPWLDGPPQTNEAGRSSNFAAAMLWLASRGLPARFECLEIGSSAGINLMMDRYAYDLGGVCTGPDAPIMRFQPDWQGKAPPEGPVEIASLKGCDVAPVDLTDPAQALRLKAYVWPEHTVRFERIEAAVAAARQRPPDLVQMNAADFVEAELAKPQGGGTTRVVMHSIVWQYVPKDQQARVSAAIEAAGRGATSERALAWVAIEANRETHRHELTVRYWPGGNGAVQLGEAHPHGAWIKWQG
jgi:hypothetical protein